MIYIYLETETPTEKKFTNEADFIKTFIEVVFSKEYNKDFVIIGFNGYKNLEKQYNKLKEHEENDYKNLVIFDSDFPVTGGGFSTRKQYLEDLKEKFKIEFELFLYPNNKDDGIFENLLEQIVNQKHQEVIEYFKEYESKLKNLLMRMETVLMRLQIKRQECMLILVLLNVLYRKKSYLKIDISGVLKIKIIGI